MSPNKLDADDGNARLRARNCGRALEEMQAVLDTYMESYNQADQPFPSLYKHSGIS